MSDVPTIEYLCLSDLHLGEEDSLLTNQVDEGEGLKIIFTQQSPVLARFAECLRDLKDKIPTWDETSKPKLVLCGDVLELALCPLNFSLMGFRQFLEALHDGNGQFLFDGIYYLPGNHDHHIWERTRETEYLKALKPSEIQKNDLPWAWNTTRMDPTDKSHPVTSELLETIVPYPARGDNAKWIDIFYPNLGIIKEVDSQPKCVVFHHGHFTEWIYSLMSYLYRGTFREPIDPPFPWDLESENFAWIDFIWSALGRSGKAGAGMEYIYEKRLDKDAFAEIRTNLAEAVADKIGLSWQIANALESMALRTGLFLADYFFDGTEKSKDFDFLSTDAKRSLRTYIEGPIRNQIAWTIDTKDTPREERPNSHERLPELKKMPVPALTFIFGHTHKPFVMTEPYSGFPSPVELHNTGGWIVEVLKPNATYGCSMTLVDSNLRAASVELYRDTAAGTPVRVTTGTVRSDDAANELSNYLTERNIFSGRCWSDFSEASRQAIFQRRRLLKKRVTKTISTAPLMV